MITGMKVKITDYSWTCYMDPNGIILEWVKVCNIAKETDWTIHEFGGPYPMERRGCRLGRINDIWLKDKDGNSLFISSDFITEKIGPRCPHCGHIHKEGSYPTKEINVGDIVRPRDGSWSVRIVPTEEGKWSAIAGRGIDYMNNAYKVLLISDGLPMWNCNSLGCDNDIMVQHITTKEIVFTAMYCLVKIFSCEKCFKCFNL